MVSIIDRHFISILFFVCCHIQYFSICKHIRCCQSRSLIEYFHRSHQHFLYFELKIINFSRIFNQISTLITQNSISVHFHCIYHSCEPEKLPSSKQTKSKTKTKQISIHSAFFLFVKRARKQRMKKVHRVANVNCIIFNEIQWSAQSTPCFYFCKEIPTKIYVVVCGVALKTHDKMKYE